MIRLKLILRNVIGKPLRTAIIIISLAAATFAALFCISGINSAKNGLRDYFSSTYGDVDLMIASSHGDIEVKEEDFPQGTRVIREALSTVSLTIPSKYFNYVNKTSITVIGIDTQLAHELRMFDTAIDTEGGISITRPLAEQFNKQVGDTMTFYGADEIEYNLKIVSIVEATRFLKPAQLGIITTPDLCNEIGGHEKGSCYMMFADIDDDKVAETIETLSEKYPDHNFTGTTSMDSDDTMQSMFSIYYLIFAVVFLMVCFIIVSMSKHIVNERMSVIGMLRSIGGSIRNTSIILLAESAFYGLFGGILGTLLFMPFRSSNSGIGLFATAIDEDSVSSDGITIGSICLVILMVILIQCIFSAAAIMKASKTPVRDIIFGTKETAYIPSKNLSIFGGVLLAAGIMICIVSDDFLMTILAAFCSVIGVVLVFPMIVKVISSGLAVLFGKLRMPIAKLAVKEIATTKSSISSSQLIISAVSLTISVLIVAAAVIRYMSEPIYHTEIIIDSAEMEGRQYEFLEKNVSGIQGVEIIYQKFMMYDNKCLLNGEEREINLLGYKNGGFRYLTGIQNCPDTLAEDEASIDKVLASKLSIHTGDEITLLLKENSYLPVECKFKVKNIIDAGYFNNLGNTIMINEDKYKSIYFDTPSTVLIKTEPGKVYEVLTVLKSTLSDHPVNIKTMEEYTMEVSDSMSSIMSVIYAIAVLGLMLSLLGTSSNLLMGFEQSKRKYAVYYSSSMSKEHLKKLILLETVFTCGISVLAAIIFGLYFLQIVAKALTSLYMSVPLTMPVLYAVLFGALSFALLSLAAIRPIYMLSKMNIAEEIKTSAD